jgi:hypothetical protein
VAYIHTKSIKLLVCANVGEWRVHWILHVI